MYIITAEDNFEGRDYKRAYIKETTRQKNKYVKELTLLGWKNINVVYVDYVMYGTLKISSNES